MEEIGMSDKYYQEKGRNGQKRFYDEIVRLGTVDSGMSHSCPVSRPNKEKHFERTTKERKALSFHTSVCGGTDLEIHGEEDYPEFPSLVIIEPVDGQAKEIVSQLKKSTRIELEEVARYKKRWRRLG